MSLDARRMISRPFAGLGGATSQALLSFDQGTLRQIKDALQGLPVAGNPFPGATSQQLALALAGSTPWKPWNQSGTIDKAIQNTIARFATIGGSDQILRSLQIATGMITGAPDVTVGNSTQGVKVVRNPDTTAVMKSGIASLLGVTAPTPSSSGMTTPGLPAPTINVTTPAGTSGVPASTVTNSGGGGANLNCSAMGMTLSQDGLSCSRAPSSSGAGGSVPLSSILGVPSTSGSGDPGSYVGTPSGAPSSSTPAPAAAPGWLDLVSAPINLPLVGPVPTWGVALGGAALGYVVWKRSKRAKAAAHA